MKIKRDLHSRQVNLEKGCSYFFLFLFSTLLISEFVD